VESYENYWFEHSSASDEDMLAVCRAWVIYQRETSDETGVHDGHPCWWAVEVVTEADNDPELLWRVIQGLCSLVEPDDEQVVGMIAAGPLWSLVYNEGDRAMDLIEPVADRNPVLIAALKGVGAGDWPVAPRIERYLATRGGRRD
jgi:hypothetical protein